MSIESACIQLFGRELVDQAMLIDPASINHRAVAQTARMVAACKNSSEQLLIASRLTDEVALGLCRYLMDRQVKDQVLQKIRH